MMIEWMVSGAVLTVIVILLRFALKGRISARLQYSLWALVLLRLLIPISFGSSEVSVGNLIRNTSLSAPVQIVAMDGNPTGTTAPAASVEATQMPEAMPEQQDTHLRPTAPKQPLKVQNILCAVWLLGIVAVGLALLLSNLRFAKLLKQSRKPMQTEGFPLPIFVSDAFDTPCLFGVFRPVIYVTTEAAANELTLRHSVAHELTHYRHGDHLWSLLRGICLALHWFDPLVWWAAALSRKDADLACDEATIRRLGESERQAYGRTLIELTCRKQNHLLLTATTMSGGAIKERITMIARKPKTAAWAFVALLLVAALAVGCTWTGYREPFLAPSATWVSSCNNLIMRSGSDTFQGDVESLQNATEVFAEQYAAMEKNAPKNADTFVRNVLRIADLLARQDYASFFDLPQEEQKAILGACNILASANAAASEKQYFELLEAQAGTWIDPWINGSSGYVLPLDAAQDETAGVTVQRTPLVENYAGGSYTDEYGIDHNYSIPRINLPGNEIGKLNFDIYSRFYMDRLGDNGYPKVSGTSYFWTMKDNILSLVLCDTAGYDGSEDYTVFNIDTVAARVLSDGELLGRVGLTGDAFSELAKTAVGNTFACRLSSYIAEVGTENGFLRELFQKTISDENIANAAVFHGEDGMLWIRALIYQPAGADYHQELISLEDYEASEYFEALLEND